MTHHALAKQLPFPFLGKQSYAEEDFIVSPSNKVAWAWIKAWPQGWLVYGGCISGPKGAGKTHLLKCWHRRTDAGDLHAALSNGTSPYDLLPGRKHWVLDDAERWLGRTRLEEPLFHWLNGIKEAGGTVLMATSTPLQEIKMMIPDVRSRLLQFPTLPIAAPDDKLLAALLNKQLKDRQLEVKSEVIDYMVARMERSFAGVQKTVATIDGVSLSRQKAITIPLVREVLEG